MNKIYTIGHSTHTIEQFISLLVMHGITAVCDVRSQPYSKFNPQFNKENLRDELKKSEIAYIFFGKEMGPRSDNPAHYKDGKVQYHWLAETKLFRQGLRRIKEGMKSYSIALMCAEKDPVMCHRMILVSRYLRSDVEIFHILDDGTVENNRVSEKRLMEMFGIVQELFDSSIEYAIQRAYNKQSEKIAYTVKKGNGIENPE
jgi:uncharacterized protein (DUF488 family)